jgi:hypothetical protein
MNTIKAYLYPNTVDVQIWDPTNFSTRNPVVYSRPVKVYQGIDNTLQICAKNQDQRPVDLTGYTLQASIQDPTNQQTIANCAVSYTSITTGIGTVTLTSDILDPLENRFYKLTVQRLDALSGTTIDSDYSVPLDLEVLPGYYSDIAPPYIPDGQVLDGGGFSG